MKLMANRYNKFSCLFFPFVYFAGIFRGGHEILLRAKLALSDGVAMQLTVRATNPEVAELVSSAIG